MIGAVFGLLVFVAVICGIVWDLIKPAVMAYRRSRRSRGRPLTKEEISSLTFYDEYRKVGTSQPPPVDGVHWFQKACDVAGMPRKLERKKQ